MAVARLLSEARIEWAISALPAVTESRDLARSERTRERTVGLVLLSTVPSEHMVAQ